ncbi:hypothetical protein K3N28_04215 [Glycomyces sp. TRM65418]|uniref:hypothetical protein n=1 Tax=Glycomyces sp. TRM65418 TaxID=2867006 RepID=UPI001CE570B2|nr:hypothetical protein [Glycomyces sp. TRM65418]MCC3762274.1 hypothetical protein [Glycomyces sp. TRM65418]QZD56330.1 hypothetical protein K3N28_04185 [Glycomyces sp. TRM65418]
MRSGHYLRYRASSMALVYADAPQEPSVPSVPPGQPQMAPPPEPGPPPQTGSPQMSHPQMAPPQYAAPRPMPPPPPSDRPSPVGLAVAGVGLALLCVSMLLPRIKIDDVEGDFGFYSLSGINGTNGFGIDASSVVLSIALLAAVGVSAHRNPALRWPARLSAIGTAALLAAFAYHPVTVLRQLMATLEGDNDEFDDGSSSVSQIDVSADSGVYLALVGALLLAVSTFLMQTNPRRNQSFLSAQDMQPPPGGNPTVTVHPG